MLVGALTSSISVKVVEETLQAKPGMFVGVLKDSPGEYFAEVLKRSGGSGENLKLFKRKSVFKSFLSVSSSVICTIRLF